MRRLKAVLRAMAADGRIRSATQVGHDAGVPKTTWLDYLNGERALRSEDMQAATAYVREVLGIKTPWHRLEEIVSDDEKTEKAKKLAERLHESKNGPWDHGTMGPCDSRLKTDDSRLATERRHLMLAKPVRDHFGLARDPFTQDVRDVDGVFLGPVHREVTNVVLDVAKFQGFGAVIAEIGWGKTILRKYVVHRLHELHYRICTVEQLDRENLTAGRIMDALLADLAGKGVASSRGREAKTRDIKKMLASMHEQGQSAVLIIDEAHALHPSTLRALKRLYEIEDGFTKLISILLFGQPQMFTRLGGWDLEEVSQRIQIIMAYGLDTVAVQGPAGPEAKRRRGKSSVPAYVAFKLERAGAPHPDKIIAADAMNLIAKVTDVPLRIHNLVTRALNLAYELGYDHVTKEIVEKLNVRVNGK